MNAPNALALRENQLKQGLLSVKKQVESLLVDKARSDKFMAAALVVAKDKALSGCNPDSIAQALVGVAMADLNVDKNVGHCYLIKYGEDVQLQIGYKGFIQLLFRAGWMVKAFPVYKCDHFQMAFDGWDNKIQFEPEIDERNEGSKDWIIENLRGVFVIAKHSETKDEYSDFIGKNLIEKLRKVSPNQRNSVKPTGIWYDWYAEMAIAKAVKKLSKKLPIGDSRIAAMIAADDKAEIGERVDYSKTAETDVVVTYHKDKPDTSEDPLNKAINPDKGDGKPQGVDSTDWVQMLCDAEDKDLPSIFEAVPDNKLKETFEKLPTDVGAKIKDDYDIRVDGMR